MSEKFCCASINERTANDRVDEDGKGKHQLKSIDQFELAFMVWPVLTVCLTSGKQQANHHDRIELASVTRLPPPYIALAASNLRVCTFTLDSSVLNCFDFFASPPLSKEKKLTSFINVATNPPTTGIGQFIHGIIIAKDDHKASMCTSTTTTTATVA